MEDRAYWVLGDLAMIRVAGDETDDRFCMVEWVTSPGSMTPLHVHHSSQTVYVLDGEITISVPGAAHVLAAGDWRHLPAGLPKTERVTSDTPARMLDVNSPAGFDRFLMAIGSPAESLTPPAEPPSPDLEHLIAAAREFGIEILGPPGALPSMEVAGAQQRGR